MEVKQSVMKTIYQLSLIALIFTASCSREEGRQNYMPSIETAYPMVDSVTLYKTYPGVLSANREVAIVARVNGFLMSKNYDSGSFVHAGDVLFTIEDITYRDALNKAESNVYTAEAALHFAKSKYLALTEAAKNDAVSRMEVEQGKSNYEEAQANLSAAYAELKTAQTQLSYCTIRAPFDGHVSAAEFAVGAYIGGENNPVTLARIYEDNKMLANFAVDDANTLSELLMNINQNSDYYSKIPINFSDSMMHRYTADLRYISPKINPSTGTIELQAVISNPSSELRSGMFVNIDLPIGTLPDAILVRDASISTDQLGKYLYLVNDSNKVVYTPIQTGQLVRDSLRIVFQGLEPSDQYVTKAILKVRDGMEVKPVVDR